MNKLEVIAKLNESGIPTVNVNTPAFTVEDENGVTRPGVVLSKVCQNFDKLIEYFSNRKDVQIVIYEYNDQFSTIKNFSDGPPFEIGDVIKIRFTEIGKNDKVCNSL